MNKNIKRIVAMALAIGGISAAPVTNANLFTTKAYASSDDADTLDSLELLDEDDNSIDLYEDDDYEEEINNDDVEEGETYYAETSSDTIKIDEIDGADEDNVRIFKGSSETAYEVGDDISLSSDTTTLKVRIYEDAYDDYDDYDEANDSDYNEYEVEVEYTGDDDNDDDENDEDTLDSLELSDEDGNTIDLYEDDEYDEDIDSDEVEEGDTYYVKTSSDEVKIEIEGPDDSYVKVFKSISDSAEGIDPGDSIYIAEDKVLTVRIYSEEPDSDITYEEDDDVIGEYQIELEYDDDSTNTSSETVAETTDTAVKINETVTDSTVITNVGNTIAVANQWVQVNGKWQYNDAMGKAIKDNWFFDKNLNKNYYLQADGNMATGWLSNNVKWYYLGSDGAMKTGWQLVDGTWYYLDSQGAMASNTTINGYKLGANGAWIK